MVAIIAVICSGTYKTYMKLDELCLLSMKRAKNIKKWRKQKARIISVRYNAHLIEKSEDAREDILMHDGISIEYEYMTKDGKTSSMSIIDFPSPRLCDLTRNTKVGDIVRIFVNPKDPGESFMFVANSDDYSDFKTRFFMESMPKLVFAQILLLSIIYLLA